MTGADRFKEFRISKKLTMRALAEALGVTSSIVSDWESGKSEIRKPNAMALELLYGLSWVWLLDGQGQMWVRPQGSNGARAIQEVPLLDGLPSCGPSGEIHELGPSAESIPFSAAFLQEMLHQCGAGTLANLFAARIQGDSMSPTILAGDTVVVNTALALRVEPRKGALHMVRRAPGSMEARVKRLFFDGSALTLHSDNRTYPPVTIPIDGVPIQDLVIGRVCWYGRSVVDHVPGHGDW